MRITQIKVGRWYETKQGFGKVVTVGGTYPPSVQITITHPFPRGTVYVVPRDFIREVPAPTPRSDEEE